VKEFSSAPSNKPLTYSEYVKSPHRWY